MTSAYGVVPVGTGVFVVVTGSEWLGVIRITAVTVAVTVSVPVIAGVVCGVAVASRSSPGGVGEATSPCSATTTVGAPCKLAGGAVITASICGLMAGVGSRCSGSIGVGVTGRAVSHAPKSSRLITPPCTNHRVDPTLFFLFTLYSLLNQPHNGRNSVGKSETTMASKKRLFSNTPSKAIKRKRPPNSS